METLARAWQIASRPVGAVSGRNFRWVEAPVAVPGKGEVRVRTIYLSIDPVQRYWLSPDATFGPPTTPGNPMPGRIWGVVEASADPSFRPGELVAGPGSWATHCLIPAAMLERVPDWPGIPLLAHTSLFCMQALTAYFGLLEIAALRPTDTVVVSAAAGAVGMLVVQIARISGCARLVAIAGSEAKCRWLKDELQVDAAINYKAGDLAGRLDAACPAGIDVYYDNVGGEILDAVLARINAHARIACGGYISHYDEATPATGIRNFSMLALKQARAEGFSCFEYVHRQEEAFSVLRKWYAEQRIIAHTHLVKGLAQAPEALAAIFRGGNLGKTVVEVSSPERAPEPAPAPEGTRP